ncbi:chitin synthase 4 [Cordyceps fumosorosea ARSEF 2679]|uniref:chitin synthase n=1 Tax=Cordyceps fumosorosea (strain ARSEF 2679) TaxID=1081104 RepID=A0A167WLR2_CORFA|nr:chitin synthase 4 [Cordyceps fumosorosea ARSEF 2679]OAA63947.1 chitin synthase 4 [Cordyceps fumosorosea ARSEF 2679]
MSLPQRPGPDSPKGPGYRNSSSRRPRAVDIETGEFHSVNTASQSHSRGKSGSSFAETISNPNVNPDTAPLHGEGSPRAQDQISRKRSLIRPERNRINKDHRNYHYHKHAANMNVLPSSTGNDPLLENLDAATERSGGSHAYETVSDNSKDNQSRPREKDNTRGSRPVRGKRAKIVKESKIKPRRKHKVPEGKLRPPTIWNVYCSLVTFWCPDFILRCCGMPAKAQQRAWREKMGLISIILMIMAIVGFLTFGFTAAVCSAPPVRLRNNKVSGGYMIFHGVAYDLSQSHHPVAEGIPRRQDGTGANVLYDLPEKHSGQDGSFLFQNVNGACKGIITAAPNSDVPTNSNGDLAWYFPCTTMNQDGSTKPNLTIPYYLGYACHTSNPGRDAFYKGLKGAADVYFSWDDIRNSSRNLMVYSGNVLDLDVLNWFNETQVAIPDRFKELRDTQSAVNKAVRGRDVTRLFQSSEDKQYAKCFQEIIKVGSVDTETVGCIASKVVLYCALVLILSVVIARFALALVFQWFISRTYAASKTSQTSDRRKRNKQIEDWSEDIYRAPVRLPGAGSTVAGSDRNSKRASSFLPTTSRFSALNPGERALIARGRLPTTMASQGGSSALLQPNSVYKQSNDSRASFLRSESYGHVSSTEGPGPAGFIHDSVVPQPPSDWMPFGFPLAHTMCLVTAYSEGVEGIRTTLDSIAMTDYPNSHKVILVICDGIVKGKGENVSTPDACLSMLKDHTTPPELVQPFSYVAVASGSKRHNMAKVHCGFYDYGADSRIPQERQQRVPMMVIVKCGTKSESGKAKAGNRGKRDSQIILMSFLQKVMFDERMTELEYEMFNGLWKVTGISPDYYEIVLMVDADTKVFPDSLTHMVSAMVKDPEIMGLCGETKIANKRASWVSAIQVFEYFISHHLAKSFESVFGGVTCLPGCFCMYRIKAPKGGQNYWVPILANPDVVEHYSENVVETLHEKNLYLLGEDRYLTTLMLRTFPKRKQIFVPQAVCKTTVPDEFMVLLSQRRRWINSTVHNLMELILVRDLCGTFCFSMQFIIFVELIGTLVLPAAIAFTFYVVITSIIHQPVQIIPLVLLGLILGLPGALIIVTAHSWSYVVWMLIYLISLPIWNFVLPTYAFWKFDDFSWGETRKTSGDKKGGDGHEDNGSFDSSSITMKRWAEFERERRSRSAYWASGSRDNFASTGGWTLPPAPGQDEYYSDA